MSKTPKFAEGERVLCYHGPLIYEAKALKSAPTKDKDKTKYLIHYAGWNKNWDEWVPENRVLKYNDANVQKQKEVSKVHQNAAAKNKKAAKTSKRSDGGKDADSRSSTPSKDVVQKDSSTPSSTNTNTTRSRSTPKTMSSSSSNGSVSGASSTSTPAATSSANKESKEPANKSEEASDAPKRKRPRLDNSVSNDQTEGNEEQAIFPKIEVKIKIPDELKSCLVEDWDMINRQHKICEIPAKTTVDQIIEDYLTYKKSTKSHSAAVQVQDVSNGILEYFNVMLGSQLLYKVERQQYANILRDHPNKQMSQIYGSVHLLRLFVKLGSLLSFTTLDDKSMQVLIGHITDFLKYLAKNISTLFNTNQFVYYPADYRRSQNQ